MFGALDECELIAHVNQQDGRTFERLLTAASGGETGVGGAVVDASYVARDPALLARFAEARIQWVTDPLSYRFASPGYLSVQSLANLPYAPPAPLSLTAKSRELDRMVRRSLEFQASHEPAMYMVPALPLPGVSLRAFRVLQHVHELAAELNGSRGIPYRPLLAAVFPGIAVMRGRYSVFERLSDRAFAGVYVQALQLNPRADSPEKLIAYASFLNHARECGFKVVAGRPGTFGLLLNAFGIEAFDSALGDAESFSLSRLTRPPTVQADKVRKGGRQHRIYFPQLMSVLSENDARDILTSPAVRAQLACNIGDCRFDITEPIEDPKRHFFHARTRELEELRRLRGVEMRVQHMRQRLEEARDFGHLVNRVWKEAGRDPVDFEHLNSWLGVLTRVATAVAVRDS